MDTNIQERIAALRTEQEAELSKYRDLAAGIQRAQQDLAPMEKNLYAREYAMEQLQQLLPKNEDNVVETVN